MNTTEHIETHKFKDITNPVSVTMEFSNNKNANGKVTITLKSLVIQTSDGDLITQPCNFSCESSSMHEALVSFEQYYNMIVSKWVHDNG